MTANEPRDALSDLGVLADRARRRLYDFVANQDQPVRRDDVVEHIDISRSLAAYHLDQLVKAGLLTASYARPPGRSGPGAGRPAKYYQRAHEEISVSIPPRNYGLLARVLAQVISTDTSGTILPALQQAAWHEGEQTAKVTSHDLMAALRYIGFEPVQTESGEIDLRNCPFGALSQEHHSLICALNQEFVRGVLSGFGQDPDRVQKNPLTSRCCVLVDAANSADSVNTTDGVKQPEPQIQSARPSNTQHSKEKSSEEINDTDVKGKEKNDSDKTSNNIDKNNKKQE